MSGFLTTIKAVGPDIFWPWVSLVYHYAWFLGFLVSGVVYIGLMRGKKF